MVCSVRRDRACRVTAGQQVVQVGSTSVRLASRSCTGRISSLVASRASEKGAAVAEGSGINCRESWFCCRLAGQPRHSPPLLRDGGRSCLAGWKDLCAGHPVSVSNRRVNAGLLVMLQMEVVAGTAGRKGPVVHVFRALDHSFKDVTLHVHPQA